MPRKKAETVNTEEVTEAVKTEEITETTEAKTETAKARVKPKDDEPEIDTNMNVYQKLAYIRNNIRKPSKTFYNTKDKFYFFSATDIRESVKDICEKLGVMIISNVCKNLNGSTCVTSDFVDMTSGKSISFVAYADLKDKALEPEERTLAETEFALRISLANMFHFNMFKGKIVFSDEMDKKPEKTEEVKNELPAEKPAEVKAEEPKAEPKADFMNPPEPEVIGENLVNATPTNEPEPEKVEAPEIKRERPVRKIIRRG